MSTESEKSNPAFEELIWPKCYDIRERVPCVSVSELDEGQRQILKKHIKANHPSYAASLGGFGRALKSIGLPESLNTSILIPGEYVPEELKLFIKCW